MRCGAKRRPNGAVHFASVRGTARGASVKRITRVTRETRRNLNPELEMSEIIFALRENKIAAAVATKRGFELRPSSYINVVLSSVFSCSYVRYYTRVKIFLWSTSTYDFYLMQTQETDVNLLRTELTEKL